MHACLVRWVRQAGHRVRHDLKLGDHVEGAHGILRGALLLSRARQYVPGEAKRDGRIGPIDGIKKLHFEHEPFVIRWSQEDMRTIW